MTLGGGGTDRGMLTSQYATSANLNARVSVYRYLDPEGDPPGGLQRWVVEQVQWSRDTRAVDVGCGPGPYTEELSRHAELVLGVDLSAGMLAEARARTHAGRFVASVADASALPLGDTSVDVVLAAHMLYHVTDIDAAVAEFHRVLRPGGSLLVVLNGAVDKQEMRQMWREAAASVGRGFEPPWWSTRANLDNVSDLLASRFTDVTIERLPGRFRFPTSSAPMTWVDSLRPGSERVIDQNTWLKVRDRLQHRIDAIISELGEFVVTKQSGVAIARRRD